MITAAARPDPATSPITTPSWPDDRVNTSYQSRLSPPPAATVPAAVAAGVLGYTRLRQAPLPLPAETARETAGAVAEATVRRGGAPAIATDPPLAMLSDGVLEQTRRHYHDRFDGGRDSRG